MTLLQSEQLYRNIEEERKVEAFPVFVDPAPACS